MVIPKLQGKKKTHVCPTAALNRSPPTPRICFADSSSVDNIRSADNTILSVVLSRCGTCVLPDLVLIEPFGFPPTARLIIELIIPEVLDVICTARSLAACAPCRPLRVLGDPRRAITRGGSGARPTPVWLVAAETPFVFEM